MTTSPRAAASVVLIRSSADGPGRWQTYLLRRSAQSPVLADLWVFPGGTVRPDDRTAHARGLAPDFSPEAAHAALRRPPGGPPATPEESFAYFVAAARELLEEAGVVLTGSRFPRRPLQVETPAISPNAQRGAGIEETGAGLRQLRRSLEDGRPLADVVAELGVFFALSDLTYYAHWITPEAVPQRFDTRFFLALLPEGQAASPSAFEMAEGMWIDAAGAIERNRKGALALHFATASHLRRLAPYGSVEELFTFARAKAVVPVMPRAREQDGRIVPFLPPGLEGAW